MREAQLHPEFYELQGHVQYVVERIRGKEWSSSCPECGGSPHPGGEWPDRFRMFPAAHSKTGISIGWCRVCGFKWLPDREFKPDPEKLEKWKRERIVEEERRKAEAEQALQLLRDEKKWEFYTGVLDFCDEGRAYWKGAGIVDDLWWREWGLGWDREHEFWVDSDGWKKHTTPTATIAERNLDGEIVNVKHRLINPQPDGVKYRMEYSVGFEPVFIANLQLCNDADWAFLVEGEKKAAVTWLTFDQAKVQAFGLPMSPSLELLEQINAGHICYIPDPDVQPWALKRIKEAYRDRDLKILRLNQKVDDYIQGAGIDRDSFRAIVKQARRV